MRWQAWQIIDTKIRVKSAYLRNVISEAVGKEAEGGAIVSGDAHDKRAPECDLHLLPPAQRKENMFGWEWCELVAYCKQNSMWYGVR